MTCSSGSVSIPYGVETTVQIAIFGSQLHGIGFLEEKMIRQLLVVWDHACLSFIVGDDVIVV